LPSMAASSESVPASVPAEEAVGTDVAATGTEAETPAAPENGDDEQQGEALFPLTIVLPHDPKKIHVMVSPQEQVHELRQSIIELPSAFQYSCFHLEFAGERINDFVQISDIKDLAPEAEIKLVEDPYTEKEARIHVIRMRDLVGAAGDRIDTLHGVLPGTSIFDSVTKGTQDFDNAQSGSYEFAADAKPSMLLPKEEEPAPKTVKSVALSAWNPPPYHYRQKGHLLYLIVTTNEGEQYQITSHVGGFYVNKSSNSKFDPTPKNAPKGQAGHSLLTLLSHLSVIRRVFRKAVTVQQPERPLGDIPDDQRDSQCPMARASADF